jgi:hypothetical protein
MMIAKIPYDAGKVMNGGKQVNKALIQALPGRLSTRMPRAPGDDENAVEPPHRQA